MLRDCYTNALAVAADLGADTVAFPLISSGVYGWPKDDAARQALTAIRASNARVSLVRLVFFDLDSFAVAERISRLPDMPPSSP